MKKNKNIQFSSYFLKNVKKITKTLFHFLLKKVNCFLFSKTLLCNEIVPHDLFIFINNK